MNKVTFRLLCHDIQRWWPNGEGKAVPLPRLNFDHRNTRGDQAHRLQDPTVKTEEDEEGGKGMVFSATDGTSIAKGANWIPMDSLFSRITKDRYDQLLQVLCRCKYEHDPRMGRRAL
jgi:beta-mannosidase